MKKYSFAFLFTGTNTVCQWPTSRHQTTGTLPSLQAF